jgi:hypothetical protein
MHASDPAQMAALMAGWAGLLYREHAAVHHVDRWIGG